MTTFRGIQPVVESSKGSVVSMFATIATAKIAEEVGYVLTCDVESYDGIGKPQITFVELY